jgi:hypothetical protein
MKITVWIRERRDPITGKRKRTIETATKPERDDSPRVHAFGRELVAAIESGGTERNE